MKENNAPSYRNQRAQPLERSVRFVPLQACRADSHSLLNQKELGMESDRTQAISARLIPPPGKHALVGCFWGSCLCDNSSRWTMCRLCQRDSQKIGWHSEQVAKNVRERRGWEEEEDWRQKCSNCIHKWWRWVSSKMKRLRRNENNPLSEMWHLSLIVNVSNCNCTHLQVC